MKGSDQYAKVRITMNGGGNLPLGVKETQCYKRRKLQ